MNEDIEEIEHVGRCGSCGTRFVGMSPDEYREKHLPECTEPELGRLSLFPTPEEERRLRKEGRLAGYRSSKEDIDERE